MGAQELVLQVIFSVLCRYEAAKKGYNVTMCDIKSHECYIFLLVRTLPYTYTYIHCFHHYLISLKPLTGIAHTLLAIYLQLDVLKIIAMACNRNFNMLDIILC